MSGLGWAITRVLWDKADYRGAKLLVLHALAHQADGKTGYSRPSVRWIADRTRLSIRQVLRYLADFRADDVIRKVGADSRGVVIYDLTPILTAWGDGTRVGRSHLTLVTGGGDTNGTGGCHPRHGVPDATVMSPLTPATDNPSLLPPIIPDETRARAWAERLPATEWHSTKATYAAARGPWQLAAWLAAGCPEPGEVA